MLKKAVLLDDVVVLVVGVAPSGAGFGIILAIIWPFWPSVAAAIWWPFVEIGGDKSMISAQFAHYSKADQKLITKLSEKREEGGKHWNTCAL